MKQSLGILSFLRDSSRFSLNLGCSIGFKTPEFKNYSICSLKSTCIGNGSVNDKTKSGMDIRPSFLDSSFKRSERGELFDLGIRNN